MWSSSSQFLCEKKGKAGSLSLAGRGKKKSKRKKKDLRAQQPNMGEKKGRQDHSSYEKHSFFTPYKRKGKRRRRMRKVSGREQEKRSPKLRGEEERS